jgi:hypothetical protein
MKRPVGIIVSSILQVLGSLFTLLPGAAALFVPLMLKTQGQEPKLPAAFFYVYSAFYLLLAALGFATAVGLWKVRRWARISTLIFAGVLVVFGLLFLLFVAFVPVPTPAGTTESTRQGVALAKAFLACLSVALGGLGGAWLYYFNRRPVKELFAGIGGGRPEGAARLPVSILVLSILNLTGAPWLLLIAWLGLPGQFLGFVVQGRAASLLYLLTAVLALYVGIGLLRLSPLSCIVAIAYYAYAGMSGLLSWALPGRDARYQLVVGESLRMWHMPIADQSFQVASSGMRMGFLMGIVISGVAIYFLVTRRSAFERGSQPAASDLTTGSSF